MERKSITGLILIVLLTLGYFWYQSYEASKHPLPKRGAGIDTSRVTALAPEVAEPETRAIGVLPVIRRPESTTPLESLVVETPLYRAIFENYGARLTSFTLKKYHYKSGGNIELVPQENQPSLALVFPHQSFDFNQQVFGLSTRSITLKPTPGQEDKAQTARFALVARGDSLLTLELTFHANSYLIDCGIRTAGVPKFAAGKEYRLGWLCGLEPTEKNRGEDLGFFSGMALQGSEYAESKKFVNDRLSEASGGETKWVATRSKYFGVAIIARSRPGTGYYADGTITHRKVGATDSPEKRIAVQIGIDVAPSGVINDSFDLYLGPLDYGQLRRCQVGLENMIGLGWQIIKPFSIAILWCFEMVHKVLPVYWIIIILFTGVIKLLTFPLTRKSTKAMQRMGEMQPKLAALKERYKGDPKRLNQETMKLYKEAGVNPFSGCLPMILQLPLWWALFNVFRTTIQLRGAPFLWIPDLSQPDTFPTEFIAILPVVMALTMFWQQKLTVKDPKQKMLVYLMPLIFFFFFKSFPAGLVLYWTVFNLLSIVEIYLTRRQMTPVPTTVPAK